MHSTTPGSGKTYIVVGDTYECLASGEDTDGAFALFHADVPAGHGPPLHTHTREDESFYILEGEINFTAGGEQQVASAGTFVFAPRGIAHRFENASGKPAKMLIQTTPAGIEHFFDEVAQPAEDAARPPSEAYIQHLVESAARHGITIHPPEPPAP
ncbi:MAG: cupin domain-containing protein [Planctomycetota bacterium]